MSCNPDKIKSAFREQSALIVDITQEKIDLTDRYVLGKIPDGGVVDPHDNNDAIIYGQARQAAVAYRPMDVSTRALIDGQMTGRDLNGFNGIFNTDINDYDDNACHGATTIDFAQGFRERHALNFQIDLDTPIKCVSELQRMERKQARAYFDGFQTDFTRFGYDNFDDNLKNLVIQYGEANASITGNDFSVTTNGWEEPPSYRFTIDFAEDYRDYIMAEMRGRGMTVAEDWMLELELPKRDWLDAIKEDQVQRYGGTGTQIDMQWFTNPEDGPLKGRSSAVWGNIKAYFNDAPVRGYYKPRGNGTYSFVRIYPEINAVDEGGGIRLSANQQYRQDTVVVDGVEYPMCTLIPHIHPLSFKRWGLAKPLKPTGSDNVSVNWDVKVIDEAYIDCNEANDKFKLFARHQFRFLAKYPEFSGYIAYRHGRRVRYNLAVTPRGGLVPATSTAGPEVFREQDIDSCTQLECAQCDQVVDGQTLQCIDPETASASILALTPSGAVNAASRGVDTTIRLAVTRTGGTGGTASVAYATANGTASSGSDYTATSGTLNWAANDNTVQYITVPLLAAATNGQNFTVTISSPTGATIAASQGTATITIDVL